MLIIFFYRLIWSIQWGGGYSFNHVQIWCAFGAFIAGLIGFFLNFFLKGLWWNYDIDGIMQYEEFDWFPVSGPYEYADYERAGDRYKSTDINDWIYDENAPGNN